MPTHPNVHFLIQDHICLDVEKFWRAISHGALLGGQVLLHVSVRWEECNGEIRVTCWKRACERFSMWILAFTVLPKSIRMGVTPSSAIITLLQMVLVARIQNTLSLTQVSSRDARKGRLPSHLRQQCSGTVPRRRQTQHPLGLRRDASSLAESWWNRMNILRLHPPPLVEIARRRQNGGQELLEVVGYSASTRGPVQREPDTCA